MLHCLMMYSTNHITETKCHFVSLLDFHFAVYIILFYLRWFLGKWGKKRSMTSNKGDKMCYNLSAISSSRLTLWKTHFLTRVRWELDIDLLMSFATRKVNKHFSQRKVKLLQRHKHNQHGPARTNIKALLLTAVSKWILLNKPVN